MSLKMTPQAKLREQQRDWLAAERAVLNHPELPECMHQAARKAVERLEGKRCQDGPKNLKLSTTEG